MPSEDTGFDQMQRLHPLTLVHRFIISLPALFLALLPALRNPDAGSWFYIGSVVLYGVFVVPLIVMQYVRFRYEVSQKEIIIHKGVFTYRHRNIPIERVQNIEIEQSLLSRVLGTAKVKIETAGSSSTEGVIEYVAISKAHEIRATVRSHQEARLRDASAVAAPPATARPAETIDHVETREQKPIREGTQSRAATEEGRQLYAMRVDRVLLSGVFRFSLLYIVVIFSATEYLGLTPEDIARWFAGDRLEAFVNAMEDSLSFIVLATAFMILLLAWITGIVTNFNRFYGFRLTLDDDKLHTRSGLLTVSEGTIPLKKVQALVIRTNPLMSAFGWYRLELQTMGFDTSDRGYQVAAPFARRDEVFAIAREIRPVEEPETLHSVSRLMIRRIFVRYAVILALASGITGYFWSPALWGFAALPLIVVFAFLQYRYHGYRASDDYLFVRRGYFRQSLWIMPIDRFQVFYLTQSIFQRRLGLKSAYVDTPGAGAIANADVIDLREDDGTELIHQLYDTFQAKLGEHRSSRSAPGPVG